MRWKGRKKSSNVEDRRRMTGGKKAMAGGGIGMIIAVVAVMLLGGDPSKLLGNLLGNQAVSTNNTPPTAAEDELAEFTSVVLQDTEDVWNKLFQSAGRTYREPKLVLFRGQVQTAAGTASEAMGPFYLSTDETIYISLSFFRDLKERFGAPGDFAQAYVIAHEVGHHVQHLLGELDKFHDARRSMGKEEHNKYSIRIELQADFYAGLWAHHADRAKNIMERGDLEEALNAAKEIGDDRIQMKQTGRVVPETFNHGTSAQRMTWFRHGFETGRTDEGDTLDDRHFRRIDPVGR